MVTEMTHTFRAKCVTAGKNLRQNSHAVSAPLCTGAETAWTELYHSLHPGFLLNNEYKVYFFAAL